ncbi:hypothetical protein B932_3794 (plasmid) [Gluconobacter oxydans H24]|nr:hypothetical protein B932_3794 [Gluconobacter oxydans H24]
MFQGRSSKNNVCFQKDSLIVSGPLRDCRFNLRRSVTILRLAADLGGERNVRFQRRNAQEKTSIVLNGSSQRST